MRVVSLLPSATETLLAITGPSALDGSGPVHLVGRSHECDWPAGVGLEKVPVLTAARIAFTTSAEVDQAVKSHLAGGENGEGGSGGAQSLYTLDIPRLKSLRPDLIITQDLCHVCSIDLTTVRSVAAQLSPQPAILSLNPHTFEAVFDDVLAVGQAINLEAAATSAIVALRERAYRAEEYINPYADRPSVAFLEWTDPIFVGGHWTPQMIERAGGQHPLNSTIAHEGSGAAVGPIGQTLRQAGKSIQITESALIASRPEYVIICPCGLSLEQAWRETEVLSKKKWWGDLPAVKRGRVAVVDGNQMFNRPGPRLVDAMEFLVGFLNDRPEVIPHGFPWRAFTRPG
jgi:ABC-type Fe3+-hydroxamate transport system substrate-binding protein